MTKYYSLFQVKKKLTDLKIRISESESDFFCEVLSKSLSKNIIDSFHEEVLLILMPFDKEGRGSKACYTPIKKHEMPKAVIAYSPVIFINNINNPPEERAKTILHEIAHFCLKHDIPKDQEDKDKKENEADILAEKWLTRWKKKD
ncbi:MAG: ImmA/IrrE family metallo-endopeptidase [Acidobacteriota bacterium]